MKLKSTTALLVVLLFYLPIFAQQAESTETNHLEQQVQTLLDSIIDQNKFTSSLDSGSFFNMPIGILAGDNADPQYALLIDEVVLQPDKAEFSASMLITNPFDGSKLLFIAEKVPFSFSGGILGDFRLELVSEKPVSVSKDIGLEVLSGSYVECDCNGFKSLSLKANLSLSKENFVEADADGQSKDKAVKSFFETTVTNWNDMVFTVSLPYFQLVNYPDFTFKAENLSVDFSDLKNPSNLVFPNSYTGLYPTGSIALWRGIYMGNTQIILNPEKFKRKNNPEPLAFGTKHLLIDENGFTGQLFGENLVGLEQGDIAGWQFSIEELALYFETSELEGGSLVGDMHIPVFDDSTNFSYKAMVDVEGNYGFTVKPKGEVEMSMFGSSELVLADNSYVNIQSQNGEFIPEACFHGEMKINASINAEEQSSTDGKSKVNIPTLTFQDFKITTAQPYVDIAYLGYSGANEQSRFSSFPLTIQHITFQSEANQARLSVGALLNLMKTSDEGFSGSTTLSLLADKEGYNYKYKGIEVDEILVNVSKPNAYDLYGSIAFARGDEIYGNAFKGEVSATFGGDITLESTALFGNKNNTPYFYVDGAFAMKPGIPAGPIIFYGFSGGLYYHMAQLGSGDIGNYSFGQTQSGLVYKPDPTTGIGIKAGVKLGMGSEQAINGDLNFEIAFNNSGGLNHFGLNGSVECITSPLSVDLNQFKLISQQLVSEEKEGEEASKPKTDGALTANFNMYKDFSNNEFHADMEMYVNIGGVLKGIGPNGRAGWAVAHSGPDEWYLHIGTPSEPLGLDLLGMVQANSYFMAGHNIPTEIPMNPRVNKILNLSPNELIHNRDYSSLASGTGLAFGSSIEISTGDVTFSMFYGNFALGSGFDIMLTDYGEMTYCQGYNKPIGINGWYASGQAYAYVDGDIGIKAKAFGNEKKFEILKIGAAALMQAQGPNPLWLQGYVGGQYSILGGLLSGDCNFRVEVGEKCEINESSPIADIEFIADITPKNGLEEVDVFSYPQVVFNVPVEQEKKLSTDEGIEIFYKVLLKELSLTDKNGNQLQFTKKWNYNHNIIVLEPQEMFNPFTEYTLNAEIGFETKKYGEWETYKKPNGDPYIESKTVSFKTGDLPTEIPENAIAFIYPLKRMYNFYQDETDKAYLIGKQDLGPYFREDEFYTRYAQWESPGIDPIKKDYVYDKSSHTVYIDIPDNLPANQIYTLKFISSPKDKNTEIDKNVSSQTNSFASGEATTDITTQKAEGTISSAEDKINYSIPFRVSNAKTFVEKFNRNDINIHYLPSFGHRKYYLVGGMPVSERFDQYEEDGTLITLTSLNKSNWFVNSVHPQIYKGYPTVSGVIDWRDNLDESMPPKMDVRIWQNQYFDLVLDDEIESGLGVNSTADFYNLAFTMPYYWANDYTDIRNNITNMIADGVLTPSAVQQRIMDNFNLRPPPPDNFYIKMDYILPGKIEPESSIELKLIHTIETDISDFDEE